jgi:plastocyanin
VLALLLVAGPVYAHGDTIRVSYSAVRPARLVVEAGTTVHFHNANASGAPCTVVFDDGSTTSPPLGRAEGWHHTFEAPGEYPFHLEEYPSRTGRVVVVAP